jgi:hypothetical protein
MSVNERVDEYQAIIDWLPLGGWLVLRGPAETSGGARRFV